MLRKLFCLISFAILLCAVSSAHAAVLEITPDAPVPGDLDISNFVGSLTDADNVGTEDDSNNPPYWNDWCTYVAHDRGGQGQTFVTGDSDVVMTGVWVKHVTYSGADPDQTWYRMQAGAELELRITDPAAAGTDAFVLASEIYVVTGEEENALPADATNDQTGTSLWFHVTLDAPVALAANTEYGFDLTSLSGKAGQLFFETDGINDRAEGGNPYEAGTAYTSGVNPDDHGDDLNGANDNNMVVAPGDHVFVVDLEAAAAPAPKIIWVSDNLQYDFDAGVPSDHGFVELLRAQGYDVDYKGEFDPHVEGNDEEPVNPDWLYWRELDADKIAELEAADLIIIGRVNSSGSFDDANEAEMWNAISTPLISQSAHISRQYSKWGWFATGSTTNKTPRLMQVTAPDHDIFAGVEIDPDGNIDLVVQDAQVTLVKLNEGVVEGNGTLLGVHDEGYPWIVEWDAGVEYYEGSGQITGGPRMFLGSAVGSTNEAAGLIEGGYNLTADGEKVFLNAVEYMLPAVPVDPVHSYTFEDGTANDSVGQAHGTLIGGAEIIDGALVNAAQDGWMEMPGDVIAMNTFDEVTIEAWYTPEEGANEGFTMLASFGLTNPDADWMGVDYFMMTSARGDDVSRAAISIGNYSDPWATESLVNGPEYDDGILHHMVATLTADAIVFYIDGVLMGSAALAGDNHIEGISQDSAYLARGSYGQDPEWIGSIEEFNIYNVALSAKQVAAKYAAGFTKPEVENLVLNPSFEEDEAVLDDPDWLQWCTWNPAEGAGSNATIVDTESVDGARSLRVEPVGTENGHFIVANISFPLELGADYTFTFWAKAEAPRPLTASFKAADNSVSWGFTDFELTTEWAEYSLTATSESDAGKLEFLCAASDVPFWIDAVSVLKAE